METSTALATREQIEALEVLETLDARAEPGSLYRSAGFIPDAPGTLPIKEQRRKAGIDFQVELGPLFHTGPNGELYKADNYVVTRNATTMEMLGLVTETYKIVQFESMDEILQVVVDSGFAVLDGCVRLRGGAIGIGRARLTKPLLVKNDSPLHGYFNVIVPHDGTIAWSALGSIIRPSCENTMRAALSDAKKRGSLIKIRHTQSAEKRVEAARVAMKSIMAQMRSFEENANRFASTQMTDAQMMALVNKLLPEGKAGITAQLSKARTKMMDLWVSGAGITPQIRGTAWAAYNAVTEYADHYTRIREETPEKRLESVLFGRAESLKSRAPDAIVEVVGELVG